jgi:16S rRNA (guanine966-N2)-methyltransferase
LVVPPVGTRPTSDRVRESLFSALESYLGGWTGLAVLDLYAGSGALGLEALSRGAEHTLLVESDRRAMAVLTKNVTAVGMPGAVAQQGDVERLVARPAPRAYDVVLADPPYDLLDATIELVLAGLGDQGWLAPEAVVVVERNRRSSFAWPTGYVSGRDRSYGDTVLRQGLWYGRAAIPT